MLESLKELIKDLQLQHTILCFSSKTNNIEVTIKFLLLSITVKEEQLFTLYVVQFYI